MCFLKFLLFFIWTFLQLISVTDGGYFEMLLNNTDLTGMDRFELLDNIRAELGLQNVKTVSVQFHVLRVPADIVISACLKGSLLMEEMKIKQGTCSSDDFVCMMGNLIPRGEMESFINIVNQLASNWLRRKISDGIKSCENWYRLQCVAIPPCGDVQHELAKCLEQITAVACHKPFRSLLKEVLAP